MKSDRERERERERESTDEVRNPASQFLPKEACSFYKRDLFRRFSAHPASVFLKYTGRNWPIPGCSFYLPVSMSRKDTVCVLICVNISVLIYVLICVHVCVLICVLICSFYVPEGHCRAILSLFTACRDGYTRVSSSWL